MTISDRFLYFLKQKKITQKEFCAMTGYGYPSLSKFLNKQTSNPGINLFVTTKSVFPEINLEWLLSGKGEMWDEAVLKEKNLDLSNDLEENTEDLSYLGSVKTKLSIDPVFSELLKTKDELIDSLRAQIEQLKKESE